MKISPVSNPPAINLAGRQLSFESPLLMGILNITPDSFSDGGQLTNVDSVLQQANALVSAGATILDIGGESSRPGANPVSEGEEKARVLPVLEALAKESFPIFLSIDTYKASVAEAAIERGACIINDISALRDPEMAPLAARTGAALILMHMRGTPETMQKGKLDYNDITSEISTFLELTISKALEAGIPKTKCMVDPGLGFGKTTEHNLKLTGEMDSLLKLECPIVYGPSRKRFLGDVTGQPVTDRDRATAAACAIARLAGAHIFRVHNIAEVSDALKMAEAVRRSI